VSNSSDGPLSQIDERVVILGGVLIGSRSFSGLEIAQ